MTCQNLSLLDARNIFNEYDTVLFDCDGVLWKGKSIIPGALEAVSWLKKSGKRVFFVTNNSFQTREDLVTKLRQFGFQTNLDEILCTSYVCASFLKSRNFQGKVYVIGPEALRTEIERVGIACTQRENHVVPPVTNIYDYGESIRTDPEVKCVVVGLDVNFTYEKMCRACIYLNRTTETECLLIGTNVDATFPLPNGHLIPGGGSVVNAVAFASGRTPIFMGKPNTAMFEFLHRKHNIHPERTLMVGDRLDTDIKFGAINNLKSLLVLTGVHDLKDVEKYRQSSDPEDSKCLPDYYIDSITSLAKLVTDT